MELVDSGSSQERRDPRMASDRKVSITQGLAAGRRGGGKVLELCNKASLIRNPLKISLVRRKIGTSMELVDSGSSQERRDPRMASDQKVSITQGQDAARRPYLL